MHVAAALVVALAAAGPLFAQAPPAATAPTLSPVPPHRKLRLAVYKGPGAPDKSRAVLTAALGRDPNVTLEDVTADDIRAGKLDGCDVLVQPGGSGGGQGRALGPEGREKVRAFVRRGGAYLGVCAGAYLATNDYSWSLGLLNARVLDKAHWARGVAPVEVATTDKGRDPLGAPGAPLVISYRQGPLLAPGTAADLPAYDEWATFRGDVALKGAPKGVMPGTTAVAAAPFGAGRVVCFSPHPEYTTGQEPLLHRALLWAARAAAAAPSVD
jgi:hypothetical protein